MAERGRATGSCRAVAQGPRAVRQVSRQAEERISAGYVPVTGRVRRETSSGRLLGSVDTVAGRRSRRSHRVPGAALRRRWCASATASRSSPACPRPPASRRSARPRRRPARGTPGRRRSRSRARAARRPGCRAARAGPRASSAAARLWPAGARSGAPSTVSSITRRRARPGRSGRARTRRSGSRDGAPVYQVGDELAGGRREADAGALVAGRDADVRRLGERADDRHVVGRQRAQAGVDAQRAGVAAGPGRSARRGGRSRRRPTSSTSRSKPTCWRLEPSSAVPRRRRLDDHRDLQRGVVGLDGGDVAGLAELAAEDAPASARARRSGPCAA